MNITKPVSALLAHGPARFASNVDSARATAASTRVSRFARVASGTCDVRTTAIGNGPVRMMLSPEHDRADAKVIQQSGQREPAQNLLQADQGDEQRGQPEQPGAHDSAQRGE